jgi:hypothetical protein
MIGEVVNRTISRAPITFVEVEGSDPTWYIAHVGGDRLPAPLPLVNGQYLYVYNLLGLRRRERYLATLEYRYVYQATADPDSWIIRYEYEREPGAGYSYAKAHVHINGTPGTYQGAKAFPALHLPTGPRVTIEQLVRHLITEHGVNPISENWEEACTAAEAHFEGIQRKRFK